MRRFVIDFMEEESAIRAQSQLRRENEALITRVEGSKLHVKEEYHEDEELTKTKGE